MLKRTLIMSALLLSGCASTQVKVNGYNVNPEARSEQPSKIPEPLIAIGVIGLGLVIGATIIGGGDDSSSGTPDTTYQDCLAAGLPEPHCRSISI